MIRKLGIDKDLSLAAIGEEELEKVEHYLSEVRENFIAVRSAHLRSLSRRRGVVGDGPVHSQNAS